MKLGSTILSTAALLGSAVFAQSVTQGTATPTTTATSTVAVGGTTSTVSSQSAGMGTSAPGLGAVELFYFNPDPIKKTDLCVTTGWFDLQNPKAAPVFPSNTSFCIPDNDTFGPIYTIRNDTSLPILDAPSSTLDFLKITYSTVEDLYLSLALPNEFLLPIINLKDSKTSKAIKKSNYLDEFLDLLVPKAHAQGWKRVLNIVQDYFTKPDGAQAMALIRYGSDVAAHSRIGGAASVTLAGGRIAAGAGGRAGTASGTMTRIISRGQKSYKVEVGYYMHWLDDAAEIKFVNKGATEIPKPTLRRGTTGPVTQQ